MKPIIYSILIVMLCVIRIEAQPTNKKNVNKDSEKMTLNLDDVTLSNKGIQKKSGSAFSQAQFIPDISLILDISYVHRSIDNEENNHLETPGNLVHVHEDGHDHGASEKGFNLNYGELIVAHTVDPYFDLMANFHLSEEGIEIEEGFVATRSLPWGLQLKGGKFLSSFGRINEQHAHYWSFAEAPLVYALFFGEHMFGDIGARLTWVAPLDTYLMLGGEVLQGRNNVSFGNEGFTDVNGTVAVNDSNGPGCYVGYLKTSFDIGRMTVLLGGSAIYGTTRKNHDLDSAGEEGAAIHAKTLIWGGDLTITYQVDSMRNISLQGEYLYRSMNGDYFSKDASDATVESKLKQGQSGFYAQLTGKFSKNWRMGARYEMTHDNKIWIDDSKSDLPQHMKRYSAMLEYNATEFSRLRLQYNYSANKYEESGDVLKRKTFHEVLFQCNMAIGAHGAHAF